MHETKIIRVARDFTRFPSGRFKRNGETSGEAFRERFLEPALRAGERVTIEMDGTIGYGSSFLEEAFGGLVRSLNMSPSQIQENIVIKTDDASLSDEIYEYIASAK